MGNGSRVGVSQLRHMRADGPGGHSNALDVLILGVFFEGHDLGSDRRSILPQPLLITLKLRGCCCIISNGVTTAFTSERDFIAVTIIRSLALFIHKTIFMRQSYNSLNHNCDNLRPKAVDSARKKYVKEGCFAWHLCLCYGRG